MGELGKNKFDLFDKLACAWALPELNSFNESRFELIAKSKKYGRVYIVTNAAEGWV